MQLLKPRVIAVALVLAAFSGAGIAIGLAAGSPEQASLELERLAVVGAPPGQLGVGIRDLDAADRARDGLPAAARVIITSVEPDSPAAEAGLLTGDIVLEFDGEGVRSARQFTRVVRDTPPARTVTARLWRDGHELNVDVTVGEGAFAAPLDDLRRYGRELGRGMRDLHLPDLERRMRDLHVPDLDVDVRMRPPRLGVGILDLRDQLAEYFGVERGVLITSVRAGSPADRAGMQAGDVITAVDDEAVATSRELTRRLARASGSVEVRIMRERSGRTVSVTLADRTTRSEGPPM